MEEWKDGINEWSSPYPNIPVFQHSWDKGEEGNNGWVEGMSGRLRIPTFLYSNIPPFPGLGGKVKNIGSKVATLLGKWKGEISTGDLNNYGFGTMQLTYMSLPANIY